MKLTSNNQLRSGMYVRAPLDIVDSTPIPGEHRDFYIGQIVTINIDEQTAQVRFLHSDFGTLLSKEETLPLDSLRRCVVFENVPCAHVPTQRMGVALCPQTDSWHDAHMLYYVQFDDQIELVPESEIRVISNYQEVSPIQQLKEYEFHSPIWKFKRDALIESYYELHSATFGVEDLVGARVRLLAHQAEVIAQVLSDQTCRYILADEVGLGKTIETCVIIKGLHRRCPEMKTLIVVPETLVRQWRNELNDKFWLDFVILHTSSQQVPQNVPGVIISHKDLINQPQLRLWLRIQDWGLLVVDEAHNVSKNAQLYEELYTLSESVLRVLLLSATPVQRRAREYLPLLKLMSPQHYGDITEAQFDHILEMQAPIRSNISYMMRDMTPEYFDYEEFIQNFEPLKNILARDDTLQALAAQVVSDAFDGGLRTAKEVLSYISTNYRIENRVIRNRRSTLQETGSVVLPERRVDLAYTYLPEPSEVETLQHIQDYIDSCLDATAIDYVCALFQAAASSPDALLAVLAVRRRAEEGMMLSADDDNVREAIQAAATAPEEKRYLEAIEWQARHWQEETDNVLKTLPQRSVPADSPHRLVQVIRAVQREFQKPDNKVLIFSRWHTTLNKLYTHLVRDYGKHVVARFHVGMPADVLQTEVDRFQADSDCRILLTDESGGEGRNFQIASTIIHADLPWTPAQIEQRIGRVDRLGRSGTVCSVVPFARQTLESALFDIWQQAFSIFTRSMSGMEIVLEEIQDEIGAALMARGRDGVFDLLDEMIERAETLREMIEEERFFEEGAINHRRLDEFERISSAYGDGERLRKPWMSWAHLAGLSHQYKKHSKIVFITDRNFNLKSIQNAKFVQPPDMTEALERSGRANNRALQGTFDRDIAVRREDLIFFAPGEPWTDTVLNNALMADRGRCCALMRKMHGLDEDWRGFEFLYSIQVDPRLLYEHGFLPVHLFKAQGFLSVNTYRVIVSTEGEIVERGNVIREVTSRPYDRDLDEHLGKRSGADPSILRFKAAYPTLVWHELINQALEVADKYMHQEFDEMMQELADEANAEFEQNISGQRAAQRWLYGVDYDNRELEIYERIAKALVEGIAVPRFQLESACFWVLKA